MTRLASLSSFVFVAFTLLSTLPACSGGGEGEGEGEDLCSCEESSDCEDGEVCAATWCDGEGCCGDGKGRACANPTRVGETCLYRGWEGGDFYDSIPCAEGLTCAEVVSGDNERFCVPDVTPAVCNDDTDCESGFGCGIYEGDAFCMVLAGETRVCAPEDGVTFTRPCDDGLACAPWDGSDVSLCQPL